MRALLRSFTVAVTGITLVAGAAMTAAWAQGEWKAPADAKAMKNPVKGVGGAKKTIEKFRRVSDDTLEYYVTFDDPSVWSRPWTLMIPLKKTGERMFEFACHEGNYGLPAILRGAREEEKRSTP